MLMSFYHRRLHIVFSFLGSSALFYFLCRVTSAVISGYPSYKLHVYLNRSSQCNVFSKRVKHFINASNFDLDNRISSLISVFLHCLFKNICFFHVHVIFVLPSVSVLFASIRSKFMILAFDIFVFYNPFTYSSTFLCSVLYSSYFLSLVAFILLDSVSCHVLFQLY